MLALVAILRHEPHTLISAVQLHMLRQHWPLQDGLQLQKWRQSSLHEPPTTAADIRSMESRSHQAPRRPRSCHCDHDSNHHDHYHNHHDHYDNRNAQPAPEVINLSFEFHGGGKVGHEFGQCPQVDLYLKSPGSTFSSSVVGHVTHNSTVVERLGTSSDVDGVGICLLNRGANALIDMPTVVARCPFW